MKKLTKIWIILLLLFSGIGIVTNHQTSPQFAFASMDTNSIDDREDIFFEDDSKQNLGSSNFKKIYTPITSLVPILVIPIIALYFLIIYLIYFFYTQTRFFLNRVILAFHLKFHYNSDYLFKVGFQTTKHKTTKSDHTFPLFNPNTKSSKFRWHLSLLKITLKENTDNELDEAFTEIYNHVQYIYSHILQESHVNHYYSPSALKKYVDHKFYKVMKKEIRLKASKGIVDDTIINQIKVINNFKLDKNLILIYFDIIEQDKKIQFNKTFKDGSFQRRRYAYAIFGKTRNGYFKIINLKYSEHSQLRNKDFNYHKNLNLDKYNKNKILES